MVTLHPAYGRDYTSKSAILADLNSGKDFMTIDPWGSQYINAEDLKNAEINQVVVRYNNQRKVTTLKRGKDGSWK